MAKLTARFVVAPVAVPSGSRYAGLSPRSALAAGQAQRFQLDGGLLRPQMPNGRVRAAKQAVPAVPAVPAVDVALPRTANDPFQLSHTASGVSVRVGLDDTLAVPAEVANGYVVYPSAHKSGAHLLHRPIAGGTEDYLAFEQRPEKSEVSYAVELRAGVAGLRLVANTLEFLDRGGAPRLRVSPPYLVDSNGTMQPATIALSGCSADTNPRAPWGRKVTPPGSDRCGITIAWDGEKVAYPALLDPRWSATSNNMSNARAEHSATVLNNGKVLIVGGLNPGAAIYGSADLYDPGTDSFAATASLARPRFRHTATLLPNGDVLVAGGQGTSYLSSTERYNGATWVAQQPLPQGLTLHTASRIEGGTQAGKVLIVGGATGDNNDVSVAQVLLYDAAGAGPGSFSVVASLPQAREAHSQVSESGGKHVIIAGGFTRTRPGGGLVDTFLNTTQVYDADANSWSAGGTIASTCGTSDGGPPMIRLAGSGKVLLSEDNSKLTQVYTFGGAWASAVSTSFNHQYGAMAQLSNGGVLLTGGVDDNVAEIWDPTINTWSQTDNMLVHRGDHTATGLGATVLLTGGNPFGGGEASATNTAERYAPAANGTGCTTNDECASGFCVSLGEGSVCCDTACDNPPPHATVNCNTGTCTISGCVGAWNDCNSNPADGCEVNTATDPNNCGGCGNYEGGAFYTCSHNHISTPTCVEGSCNGTCDVGWGDCNNDETVNGNGCEQSLTAAPNCGACGSTCIDLFDENDCTANVCNVVGGTGVCANPNVNACSQGCSNAAGCGYTDTDGDGLNDIWESNGYVDINCNGIYDAGVDTPLPGANVNEPDVYVKWDYLVLAGGGGHTHQPSAAAMALVQTAFGNHHSHLHYFPTSDSIPEKSVVSLAAPGSAGMGASCAGTDAVSLYDLKAAHFPSYLNPAYHYVVFAHYSQCDSDTHCAACPTSAKTGAAPAFGLSGIGELPGSDFIVSLGSLTDAGVDPMPDIINAGTFMHELGHNLSLRHGGTDDLVQKPNYFSVMNYSYQYGIGTTPAPGPYDSSTTDPSTDYHIDYSAFAAGTLREGMTNGANACVSDGSGGMSEPAGISGGGAGDHDVTIFYADFGGTSVYGPTNGTAVDWDNTLPATDLHVYADVSGDGRCDALLGYNDWLQTGTPPVYMDANLTLGFQCNTGNWADGVGTRKKNDNVDTHELTGHQIISLPLGGAFKHVKVLVRPACVSKWIALSGAGTVPVAALGSASFDVRHVDPLSLRFAGAAPVSTHTQDVNLDGKLDIVGDFPMASLHLSPTATSGDLVGKLYSGQAFGGSDSVKMIPDAGPVVKTKTLEIYEDEPRFQQIEQQLKVCSDPPVLPFRLSDCSAAADRCGNQIDVNHNGKISRIEFWANIMQKDLGKTNKLTLQRAQDAFDHEGCQNFSFHKASANLPFDSLDDLDAQSSFYLIFFDVTDVYGDVASASCRVNIFGTHNIAANGRGQAPVPLSCAVCIGTGCERVGSAGTSSCPGPATVCPYSTRQCADLKQRCQQRGDCSDYKKICTYSCGQDDDGGDRDGGGNGGNGGGNAPPHEIF